MKPVDRLKYGTHSTELQLELDARQLAELRQQLLEWFWKNRRQLPWRQKPTPYRVWISEVMLQQTRVETVVPYFQRFVETFPDVYSLAKADVQRVLKLWEGLGYYSRARNLLEAAREIVSRFGGVLPRSYRELLKLKGIGPYTAAAIASIAFGEPVAVVDGNVIRVITRLFVIREDPRKSAIRRKIAALAQALLEPEIPGDWNQAMMELGATLCLPAAPDCENCPVRVFCRAKQEGNPRDFPMRASKKPLPFYEIAVGIIWKDGKILIARRPENGLLGGLWEFPGGKREAGETLEECVQREVLEELNIVVEVGERFVTVDHAYSHFRIRLHAFRCRWLSGEPECRGCTAFRWVEPGDLGNYPFPRANQKVIEQLQGMVENSFGQRR